jgi:D-sedoheptulose 7-phosphate isomerase
MIDINGYLSEYDKLVNTTEVRKNLAFIGEMLEEQRENRGRLLIFGNGAASSIAGHAALDFTKQGKLRSLCFHDPALLTAFANDFGYEKAYAEIISHYYEPSDIVIFVSVSGESPNIIEALKRAKNLGMRTIGFSGKSHNNSLNSSADYTFWVNSQAYNIVENVLSIWLLSLCDFVIGESVYEVS